MATRHRLLLLAPLGAFLLVFFVAPLAWLLSGVFFVPTDQQAVVTRMGALVEPRVMPGVHYALPWPVDRVRKLKVNAIANRVNLAIKPLIYPHCANAHTVPVLLPVLLFPAIIKVLEDSIAPLHRLD